MNWTVAIADLLVIVGASIIFIWRLSDANRRVLNMEERQREHHDADKEKFAEHATQIAALRAWKHDKVNPFLQALWMAHEDSRKPFRVPGLPSYEDLSDSRVTNDPKSEPRK